MKIFLLEQSENSQFDYYESCVVIAKNKEEAAKMHPEGFDAKRGLFYDDQWASSVKNVKVTELGEAHPSQKKTVVLASYVC